MPSGVSERIPLICVLDPDGLVADDLRHQLERLLHLRREVLLRERELGRCQRRLLDGGQVVRVVQDRAVRVRADLEPGSRPGARTCSCPCRERSGTRCRPSCRRTSGSGPMSIIWCTAGRERDRGAGHAREPRAPDAARDHDGARPRCRRRVVRTRRTRPPSTSMPSTSVFGEDRQRPEAWPALAHDRPRPQRVDDADGRRVEAAEDHRLVDERDELLHLRGRHERDRLDAPGLRRCDTPARAPASAPRSGPPRSRLTP